MTNYPIESATGTTVTTISQNTVDTTFTIRLFGRGIANYGDYMAENLFRMLQNFASANPPGSSLNGSSGSNFGSPTAGQQWWDTANQTMRVYNGSSWLQLATFSGSSLSGTAFPSSPVSGQIFYKSSASPGPGLFYYNGSDWKQVDSGSTTSTNVADIFTASGSELVGIVVDDTILGLWSPASVLSADLPTTPRNYQTAFPSGVNVGLNLSNVSNNLFRGTALESYYADVAERYHADKVYEPGTLVKLGGECEITQTVSSNDDDVFGVISTNPAIRLNSSAGDDKTHPFVGLIGRVPCKVVGKLRKGQRLVSSNIPGVAMGMDENCKSPFAVIGRAINVKNTDEIELVEVTIGVK